jgi:soluble lytic murein transglycosylase-like protein
MLAAAAVVLALAVGADPRPALVEAQLDSRLDDALALTDKALAQGGDEAAALGLDYLRGHLLDRLGRRREAAESFARALATTPRLALFSRYRLAADQERIGHPEVAAGLIATVVAEAPPSPLLDAATELFVATLGAGGDCRLLGGIDRSRFGDRDRRLVEVAAADCERREHPERARALYVEVLRGDREDEPAGRAATGLAALAGAEPADEVALLLGRTFHWHRRFDLARPYLQRVTSGFGRILTGDQFDVAYTLVRGTFWQEDFATAAVAFADLAERTADHRRQAQALFQAARSRGLAGQWPAAAALYRRAYLADPLGRLADAALLGALRLEWRSGDEEAASEAYEVLAGRRQWIATSARASLFLAASDLVQGRRDRAGRWLDMAERAGREVESEVAYWRGRLAELDGEPSAALGQYLRVLERDPFHPLAEAARRRLAGDLLAAAVVTGRRLAASSRPDDQLGAWLLLGDGSAAGRNAHRRLHAHLAADRLAGPILALAPVPIAKWPLWSQPPREPEETLLALGILSEGAPAVTRLFPLTDPDLAYTGALLLSRAGEVERALQRADTLRRRAGNRVVPTLLPPGLRRLLYPFAYSELVVEQSLRRRIDPYLLAAILREESRFDPRAMSSASARGLAQFVEPTASELGRRIGLGEVSAADLYRPEVAIALAAAHLQELDARFDGSIGAVVAAYNAGAPQSELWRRYCFSAEPAEFFSKVGFEETRAYLVRVLRSWGEYRDIYRRRAALDEPPPAVQPEGRALAGRTPSSPTVPQ